MPQFLHHDLRLLNPTFASPLTDLVTELEYLRRLQMSGTTPLPTFMQLKSVFHLLESLASARIEGNHTTLADYVETKVSADEGPKTDALQEILNIENAMRLVESSLTKSAPLSEHLLRGLHETTVAGLQREGDKTPGAYRGGPVQIAQAEHLPPGHLEVPAYMAELIAFINRDDPPKYDLMKVALAHHRFAWIHPFGNGNGRVVRLLTYALLIKYGFQVSDMGRLLNPAAVFCADRVRYYEMLGGADTGTDEGLEAWCTYVLTGVLDEMKKVDQLADYAQLQSRILLPAVAYARERQVITAQEASILHTTIRGGIVKSADLEPVMPGLSASQRTYQIRKLVENRMIAPISAGARQYTICFSHSVLLRGVIRALTDEGFIPTAVAGQSPA